MACFLCIKALSETLYAQGPYAEDTVFIGFRSWNVLRNQPPTQKQEPIVALKQLFFERFSYLFDPGHLQLLIA